jgi:hypothetical protein
MHLPLAVTRAGSQWAPEPGYTENISSGGVLFTSGHAPHLGDSIEYLITLDNRGRSPLSLRCVGKVVRFETQEPANGRFQVAATLERYEFVRAD